MVKLIEKPAVFKVAAPTIDIDGLFEWIKFVGLEELTEDETTPLSQLIDNVCHSRDNDSESLIELAGRQCYNSYAKGRPQDAYLANILDQAHGSVTRHSHFSFMICNVSRTLTHEFVRHAAGVAISQQSQRYINSKNLGFVVPPLMLIDRDEDDIEYFRQGCYDTSQQYEEWQRVYTKKVEKLHNLTSHEKRKRINEAARSILPGCIETGLTWTANIQALRFVIQTRGTIHADLEIRRLAVELLKVSRQYAPILFADLVEFTDTDGLSSVKSTEGYRI